MLLGALGNVMDWKTFCHWKRLDSRSPLPHWFEVTSRFLLNKGSTPTVVLRTGSFLGFKILNFEQFDIVHGNLLGIWSDSFDIYTDGSLKFVGSSDVISETAVYFSALDMGIGVDVYGLLFSTLSELQAVALALECILSFCSVVLYLNSQAAIDACVSEIGLTVSDFHNHCWIKRRYVATLIRDKNLTVSWVKIKSHSGILGNNKSDAFADEAAGSLFFLPAEICEWFLVAENTAILDNARYFVRDIFRSICCVHWKAGPGQDMVSVVPLQDIDWVASAKPEISKFLYIYVESFTQEAASGNQKKTVSLAGVYDSSFSSVLKTLSLCFSDVSLYSVVYKEFVLKDWCMEAVTIFNDAKSTSGVVVNFVRHLAELYWSKAWLAQSKFRADIERAGLVGDDSLVMSLSHCVLSILSDVVIRLLGIADFFAVNFGCHKLFWFFSGLNGNLCVRIGI
ncbi:hypothetical protein G9A89_007752 [Geosiphon pyriformis]|nr:hypothetical protein G9A89_007752 [Geosiphon pyriformis]